MYFTSGSDWAFEQLMQARPGADHFDNGEAGAPGTAALADFTARTGNTSFVCIGMINAGESREDDPEFQNL